MFAHLVRSYSRVCAVGHSITTIVSFGSRSSVGAYNPTNCRRHHFLAARFSAIVVNQYCQSTARICRGGSCGKGLPAKRASTFLSLERRRSSVFGTIGYSRQEPRDANHKFQSNRG